VVCGESADGERRFHRESRRLVCRSLIRCIESPKDENRREIRSGRVPGGGSMSRSDLFPAEKYAADRVVRAVNSSASLVLMPGYVFQVMVFGFLGMLSMEVLVALTTKNAWDLLPLLVPLMMFLVGLLYYRAPRFVRVDSSGITLERTWRQSARLSWEEVRLVRYTLKRATKWVYLPVVARSVLVQGVGRRNRILIEDALYRLHEDSAEAFANVLLSMARERSVHVVEERSESAARRRKSSA